MMNQRRHLPSVRAVLETPALAERDAEHGARVVTAAVRTVIDEARRALATGDAAVPDAHALGALAAARLDRDGLPPLRPVVNATGIIIHTGLGRAPLGEDAVTALAAAARGYAPVELDMVSGARGRRVEIVEDLLCELTGAEAATVVNNNAAALALALMAVATDREVIVSRGELVEIGGSFRLPELMTVAGARLREVGTTNRTRRKDYESAVGPETAAILSVHPSNYRIEGFTESVGPAVLAELARDHDIPFIHDVGSGALVDLGEYGLRDEPSVRDSIGAGADLVLFSGDKLLGGPQAGIIVGRRDLVRAIDSQPMMRAMRVGKLILAALGPTLQAHRDAKRAESAVPVMAMLSAPLDVLSERASRVVAALRDQPGIQDVATVESEAYLGGGANPATAIPSVAVVVRPQNEAARVAERLRHGEPAVVVRTRDASIHLDMRTVSDAESDVLVEATLAACRPETH